MELLIYLINGLIKERMKIMSKNFGKLLAGIGIGVGLGLLFAPETGKETREKLKKKLNKMCEDLKNVDVEEVKDNIMEQIEEKDIYNYYLQIYAVAYCCLHGKTYHITEYPIRVTRPPQKDKAWGYGDDGLIGDVFSNFVKLDISNFEKMKLEMKFLTDQYWRYAMYLKKGIGKFFGCIAKVIKSPNTVWPTKIIFACSFLFILGWKAISLLFSGKLWKTLSTKVDI